MITCVKLHGYVIVRPVMWRRVSMEENKKKIYYVSSKNKTIALLLTLLGFVGVAGLQRIYVGRYLLGFVYIFTCGLFFIGTIYDIIQLCYEKFKDADGYPLYSKSSMKRNYRHRKLTKNPSIIHWSIAFICVLLVMGFYAFRITTTIKYAQQLEQKTESTEIKEETKSVKIENENVDEDLNKIVIEIELDQVLIEGKRKFLVNVNNTSNYPFDGVLHVNAKGMGALEGLYDLKNLQPGQTKTFIGKGDVDEFTTFRTSIQGNFKKQQKDTNLSYQIVKQYGGNGMMTYFVYVKDFSDANLTAISTEMYKNYSGKVHDLEIRFTKVQNNPSLDDSLAMYSIHPMNKALNHKLVWFNKSGDVERVIATIP